MGKPAARMGDMTAHGGTIVAGAPTVLIGGQPAARVGDNHVCPMVTPGVPPIPHVGGPIMPPGVPTVMIAGMPAACVGDMAMCTGPPDTIIPPGCPTVLIGSGGGGGGGSGAGSGGSGGTTAAGSESEVGDSHYLHVKFVDKGGKPVTGVAYSVKSPDDQKMKGSLVGRVKKTGLKQGNYDIALKAVTKAEWSVKKARVGDTVKLKAEVAGTESGAEAIFRIFEKDVSSADDLIETIRAETSGDKVEAEWEYRYVEDTDDTLTEREQQRGYSVPEYYFIVQVEDSTARSGILEFRDYVEVRLKNPDGNPVADARYRIFFSNGQVKEGTLDSNGYKKIENVPPGEWSVSFPDAGPVSRASS